MNRDWNIVNTENNRTVAQGLTMEEAAEMLGALTCYSGWIFMIVRG